LLPSDPEWLSYKKAAQTRGFDKLDATKSGSVLPMPPAIQAADAGYLLYNRYRAAVAAQMSK
jgi:hypothetical protein